MVDEDTMSPKIVGIKTFWMSHVADKHSYANVAKDNHGENIVRLCHVNSNKGKQPDNHEAIEIYDQKVILLEHNRMFYNNNKINAPSSHVSTSRFFVHSEIRNTEGSFETPTTLRSPISAPPRKWNLH